MPVKGHVRMELSVPEHCKFVTQVIKLSPAGLGIAKIAACCELKEICQGPSVLFTTKSMVHRYCTIHSPQSYERA